MNKDLSDEAKERFLREIGLCLKRAGFQTEPRKNGLLAVSWNGASLCRVNANGGAQFRKEELDAEGASEAFHRALNVTEQTVAYLRLMESAPTLKARGLDGDYRLLLDFNGTVLAAHATNNGAEFVTWEWDYDQRKSKRKSANKMLFNRATAHTETARTLIANGLKKS